MARRKHRKRPPQKSVQVIQILGLVVILLVILLFRDKFSLSAGAMMDAMGANSEDVKVPVENQPQDGVQPAKEDSEVEPAPEP